MSVLLVGEAPNRHRSGAGSDVAFLKSPPKCNRPPVSAMTALMNPGGYDAGISLRILSELFHSDQIPFEVATGNAQAGAQIGVRTNPIVESQGRRNFRPVSADVFAHFSQQVCGGNRRDQEKIDGDFRQFRAFVAHEQDRAVETFVPTPKSIRQRPGRVRRADDVTFRLERAFDGAAKNERLDLIKNFRRESVPQQVLVELAGETRIDLA